MRRNTALYFRAPSSFTASKLPSAYSIRLVLLVSNTKHELGRDTGQGDYPLARCGVELHEKTGHIKESFALVTHAARRTVALATKRT
jgi:hypothetical protein